MSSNTIKGNDMIGKSEKNHSLQSLWVCILGSSPNHCQSEILAILQCWKEETLEVENGRRENVTVRWKVLPTLKNFLLAPLQGHLEVSTCYKVLNTLCFMALLLIEWVPLPAFSTLILLTIYINNDADDACCRNCIYSVCFNYRHRCRHRPHVLLRLLQKVHRQFTCSFWTDWTLIS